jgi:HSP20 family protein
MTNQTEPDGAHPAAAETNPAEPTKALAGRSRMPGFADLFDEMDRFWATFPSVPSRFRSFGRQRLMPALDVFEKDGKMQIHAELPGMKDSDIEIEIDDDVLTISGEKRDEREVKEDNYYRSERTYGSFRRQVALPAGADTDQVEAKFKDGVLKIEVPIKTTPEPARKKVEVKTD